MKTEDFDFDLDESKIAQFPIKDRDHSKLLIMDKKTGEIEHKMFYDIIDYLNKGDVLVLNDTKVLPARLYGNRVNKEEKIEVLLITKEEDNTWECLVKPGKKLQLGTEIEFGNKKLRGKVVKISNDGSRYIKFSYEGIFEEILDELGSMPLPPYIKQKLEDKDRYQTVYANNVGSAAAPTAGLHFTKDLLKKIKDKGIKIAYVTLHVGIGTFRPIKVENFEEHKMHSEFYILNKEECDKILEAKKNGNSVIAVGTTSIRTLESIYKKNGKLVPDSDWTDIFIYPGFEFKVADKMITNFHLPKSTLIMLVSAFSNREYIMNAYDQAIKNDYKFFSFGDAMFIK